MAIGITSAQVLHKSSGLIGLAERGERAKRTKAVWPTIGMPSSLPRR